MDGIGIFIFFGLVLVVAAIFNYVRWKEGNKLREQPLEKFIVVLKVYRSESFFTTDMIGEAKPGETINFVKTVGGGKSRRRIRVHLGRVISVKSGVIEVQGNGRRAQDGLLVPEDVVNTHSVSLFGLRPGDEWRVTSSQSGWLVGKIASATILEVRALDAHPNTPQVEDKQAQVEHVDHQPEMLPIKALKAQEQQPEEHVGEPPEAPPVETPKEQEEQPERYVIVFSVHWHVDTDLIRRIKPGDPLGYLDDTGTWVQIGKVTRAEKLSQIEPGVIEVESDGGIHDGFEPSERTWKLTGSEGDSSVTKKIEAKVLEIRPVSEQATL